jgi:hypothetical protein
MLVPRLVNDWWTIAGNPDLGEPSAPEQQPVDFSLWQAADATWQLQSCIRNTKCGGMTRLFHRWEGRNLADSNWKPKGIAMQADLRRGETPGGLQAPYVTRGDGRYLMFYGDFVHICLAESHDGRTFERRLMPNGRTGMFDEGEKATARDPMAIIVDGTWYCYYCAFPEGRCAVYCRTSKDLVSWSTSKVVAYGGSAGTGPYSAECPFVVQIEPGYFHLFRTQEYADQPQTSVYRSADPMDFGVESDRYLVCRLPVAAPEIVTHEGRFFIACLLPSLTGIRVGGLQWIPA